MPSKRIYFISDAHFGISLEGHEKREEYFFELLDSISEDAEGLIILGDLFDFWIEYNHAIRPDYFAIIHALKKLLDKGIWIHYMAGNHDFALGSFLEKTVGITIHHDTFETVLQGKKIHLYHGDGLLKRDWSYRILRKILRNPLLQRFYKVLHPNVGVPVGTFCSGSSRKYLNNRMNENRLKEYRMHAKERIDQGNDIVMFGHTHHGEVSNFENGVFCNTGAWLVCYNYATLTDGKMKLWRYNHGALPEEIPSVDRK